MGEVYAGGYFDAIGRQSRHGLAALDATTGLATGWNPDPDSTVLALAVSGSIVYVGGDFSSLAGQDRYCIAAVDATTGAATGWNPGCEGGGPIASEVTAIAVAGHTVYVGGTFESMGGRNRLGLAAVDASTGRGTSWNPNPDLFVKSLAVSGSTVYVGGDFTSIGGRERSGIAQLDVRTARAMPWAPSAGIGNVEGVNVVAVSGSTVFAGGGFTSVGGVTRHGLAQLDARTGRATSWNPDASGGTLETPLVRALAASGSTLYVGGAFSSIGGRRRNDIAALDTRTGRATPWNPRADDGVTHLVVAGSTIYVAGIFSHIGHSTRKYIAALDAHTGRATAWNPRPDEVVDSLTVDGSTVYAGGAFTTIGGRPRNHIAALDVRTGSATTWNPNANSEVEAIAVSGTTVFIGGYFTRFGGQRRSNIAALDTRTGTPTAWNPDCRGGSDPAVFALAVSGATVYAGGGFTHIGGQKRTGVAALDARTGRALRWNPNPDARVTTIAASGSKLYLGGNFGWIADEPHTGFVAFRQTPDLGPPPAAPVDGLG